MRGRGGKGDGDRDRGGSSCLLDSVTNAVRLS